MLLFYIAFKTILQLHYSYYQGPIHFKMLVLDDKTVTANYIVKKRKLTIVKNAIELVVKPQENVYLLNFNFFSAFFVAGAALSVDELAASLLKFPFIEIDTPRSFFSGSPELLELKLPKRSLLIGLVNALNPSS